MLRYRYGGGRPPSSLEFLFVEPAGVAWYLAGNPWPRQPPFDEIGAYRTKLSDQRLLELGAAAAAHGASRGPWSADSGVESVAANGASAGWDPEEPPEPAAAFVREAREVIAHVRAQPFATALAALDDGGGLIRLTNRGTEALTIESGQVHRELREEVSGGTPSPLRLGRRPPVDIDLPDSVPPGESLELSTAVPEGEGTVLTALVHIVWKPPLDPGEGDGRLDGWILPDPLSLE